MNYLFTRFKNLFLKKKEPEPLPENPRKEAYSLVCKIGYKNMNPDEFKKLKKRFYCFL